MYSQVSVWIHVPMYVGPKRRYGFSYTAVTSLFTIQFSALYKNRRDGPSCLSSTWAVEAGESEVRSHPKLPEMFSERAGEK